MNTQEKNQEQSGVEEHEMLDPWWKSEELMQQREDEELGWCLSAGKREHSSESDQERRPLHMRGCVSQGGVLRKELMEGILYLVSWKRWWLERVERADSFYAIRDKIEYFCKE